MYRDLRAIAVCAAVSAGLGLAACGGDDTPKAPSKDAVIARAETICADANRTEQAVVREGPGWHYGPKFRDPQLMTRFTKAGREALGGLRALQPPAANRASFDEVLSDIDDALAAIEAEIASVRAGGGDATTAHTKAYERAYADLAVSAGKAGLTECQGVGF